MRLAASVKNWKTRACGWEYAEICRRHVAPNSLAKLYGMLNVPRPQTQAQFLAIANA